MWFKEKFENHVREGGAIILWWVVEHGYLGKKREREKDELATHNMQACTDTLTLFCPFLCRSSILRWLLSVCMCVFLFSNIQTFINTYIMNMNSIWVSFCSSALQLL